LEAFQAGSKLSTRETLLLRILNPFLNLNLSLLLHPVADTKILMKVNSVEMAVYPLLLLMATTRGLFVQKRRMNQ
jgi:hypothetical protein